MVFFDFSPLHSRREPFRQNIRFLFSTAAKNAYRDFRKSGCFFSYNRVK